MDFFNPISYAWNLEPYTAQWGNSPPVMMLTAYALSIPIKLGISRYLVYLGFYMINCVLGACAIFWIWRKYTENSIDAIMATIIAFASFPFLYCFDRGNYVFFAAVMIMVAIMAYDTEHYYVAAILIGFAAALKVYPALLGTLFLADKKIREAFVCALTGIVSTTMALFLFKGSFVWNLNAFMEKTKKYATLGNENLGWLVDDKNSFYQIRLVPKMMGNEPLTGIEQVPTFVTGFKWILFLVLAITVFFCLLLKRNHDRVLVLTMMMIGFPLESGVYNLVLAVFPVLYWSVKEKNNKTIPIMGGRHSLP